MITEDEWRALMDDAQQTLDKFQVTEIEQHEVTQILESTKEAILGAPLVEP